MPLQGKEKRVSPVYRAKRVFQKWSAKGESNYRVLSPISTCFQSVAKTYKAANFQPSLPPPFISHLRCERSDGNEPILNLLHFRSPTNTCVSTNFSLRSPFGNQSVCERICDNCECRAAIKFPFSSSTQRLLTTRILDRSNLGPSPPIFLPLESLTGRRQK